MTTVNLSQQQYRDARKQFGRSTIVQLLIFMGIELGVEVLFYVINLFQNFLFNVVSNMYSFEIGMQFLRFPPLFSIASPLSSWSASSSCTAA